VDSRGEPRTMDKVGRSICIGLKGYLWATEPDLGRPVRGLEREINCSGSSTCSGMEGERRGGNVKVEVSGYAGY
jgi:hypothetical protein